MFGLSWDQIILIVLAALFLLGPERIPTAIKWLMDSLRKVRTFAAGAQSEMRSQLGPELDELRRQIAELQSLKELKELRELRDLDPRRMVGKSLLGEEFSGGIKGFLGLTGQGPDAEAAAAVDSGPGGTAAGALPAVAEAAATVDVAPQGDPPGITAPGADAPEVAAAPGADTPEPVAAPDELVAAPEAATPIPAPAGQWSDAT